MKYNSREYSLKVWLTSVIAPGLFLALMDFLLGMGKPAQPATHYLPFLFEIIVYGLLYSVILWLIMWYVVKLFTRRMWAVAKIKLAILLIAELSAANILICVALINKGSIDFVNLLIWFPYVLTIWLAVRFYKLEPINSIHAGTNHL